MNEENRPAWDTEERRKAYKMLDAVDLNSTVPKVNLIDWKGQSSELNKMYHVWDLWGIPPAVQAVWGQEYLGTTENELKEQWGGVMEAVRCWNCGKYLYPEVVS